MNRTTALTVCGVLLASLGGFGCYESGEPVQGAGGSGSGGDSGSGGAASAAGGAASGGALGSGGGQSTGGTSSGAGGSASGGNGSSWQGCDAFEMPDDCTIPDGAVLPGELRCTGLYSDWQERTLRCGVRPYAPAHELWADGAAKQRYVWLPPESSIDVSDPDDWDYPIGTRFWKEFYV